MKYFKIIYNGEIVGVVTDANFVRFYTRHNSIIRATLENGEYVEYKGELFRDSWMRPLVNNNEYFKNASIREINEEEYAALKQSLETNETIADIEPEIVEPVVIDDPDATMTLEYIRSSKITEMSRTCNRTIEGGFNIQLSDGEIHHFSLTTQDQLNLISLSQMAANGMEAIPYHADGEICRFYSAADMNAIVAQATAFKIYHTTYYNALKNYINALDTIEDIAAITYGVVLPEEYQSDVLKTLIQ